MEIAQCLETHFLRSPLLEYQLLVMAMAVGSMDYI